MEEPSVNINNDARINVIKKIFTVESICSYVELNIIKYLFYE